MPKLWQFTRATVLNCSITWTGDKCFCKVALVYPVICRNEFNVLFEDNAYSKQSYRKLSKAEAMWGWSSG